MFNIINKSKKAKALRLRKQGLSLSEIKLKTGISKSTLSIMLRNTELSVKARNILREKNFKSKSDSLYEWEQSSIWSKENIGDLNERDQMIILAMIYWGEGTKRELNIINSDPEMLRIFISCLRKLNINEDDIRIGLRLFPNCNLGESKLFWSEKLKIKQNQITGLENVEGSKKHKHAYGMCRIRVKKGGLYFKRIMSIISHVKEKLP